MEEKHGKTALKRKRGDDGVDASEKSDESSSESEDEDDDGMLATKDVDEEIAATLQAIRTKDPRVYDEKVNFYTPFDPEKLVTGDKAEKPMHLRDYHRENLLKAANGENEDEAPKSFAQEQEELRQNVVKSMHAANDSDSDDDSEDGGFLVPKTKPTKSSAPAPAITEKDIEEADKDPETFLSNFLAARAWVPTERSDLQPFESDDDEEEDLAEKFEHAYNLRFEDPNTANERLVTHARDIANKHSVRREEVNSRKKRRLAEQEKKEAERRERHEERARLRKLKLEELEEKVKKIQQAAGMRGADLNDEDWAMILDDDFDDKKWEEEMQKRFDDNYYAEADAVSDNEDAEGSSKSKRRPKKPTWDDDIDIQDLVPDFDDETDKKPEFSLSDIEEDVEMVEGEGEDQEESAKSKKKSKKAAKDEKKEAKAERRRLEALVDRELDLEPSLLPTAGSSKTGHARTTFRYRETSPTTYGLTARDILMAEDKQLNEFAGLKKLASFRDEEKKRKDAKKLGKKARLRQWRRETFGSEDGPSDQLVERAFSAPAKKSSLAKEEGDGDEMEVDIREGKKKRKRSRKGKGGESTA